MFRLRPAGSRGGPGRQAPPGRGAPDYTVVAGHLRLQIAKELGFEKVPVEIVDGDPECLEYLLVADNEERRVYQGPIKKAKRTKFLQEYWEVKGRPQKLAQNALFNSGKTLGCKVGAGQAVAREAERLEGGGVHEGRGGSSGRRGEGGLQMSADPQKKIILRRERVQAVRDALDRLEKAETARDVAACLRDLEQAVWWLRCSVNRVLLPWGEKSDGVP